jgi:hypothetical protein
MNRQQRFLELANRLSEFGKKPGWWIDVGGYDERGIIVKAQEVAADLRTLANQFDAIALSMEDIEREWVDGWRELPTPARLVPPLPE